jgi:hypothetical protein
LVEDQIRDTWYRRHAVHGDRSRQPSITNRSAHCSATGGGLRTDLPRKGLSRGDRADPDLDYGASYRGSPSDRASSMP